MMGDREKCIQAQMDEYLSKPLQQNHLIQTILKCATLGGQLLLKNREREVARQGQEAAVASGAAGATGADATGSSTSMRPSLEGQRAFTSKEPLTGPSVESPALVTADQDDPIARARTGLSDLRSLTS
jgi:osomolarity two-component system, sensor histidine kinase NIK1